MPPAAAPDVLAWMTTGDTAKALGVSTSRVIQMANEGRLRCELLRNGWRLFDPESVAAEQARRR